MDRKGVGCQLTNKQPDLSLSLSLTSLYSMLFPPFSLREFREKKKRKWKEKNNLSAMFIQSLCAQQHILATLRAAASRMFLLASLNKIITIKKGPRGDGKNVFSSWKVIDQTTDGSSLLEAKQSQVFSSSAHFLVCYEVIVVGPLESDNRQSEGELCLCASCWGEQRANVNKGHRLASSAILFLSISLRVSFFYSSIWDCSMFDRKPTSIPSHQVCKDTATVWTTLWEPRLHGKKRLRRVKVSTRLIGSQQGHNLIIYYERFQKYWPL